MTRRPRSLLLAALLTLPILARAEDPRHIVMISIDGLMPSAYTQPGPSRIPTLRRLAREGAFAEGVMGVLPTVTYPSHTSLITGVRPSVHGIVDNHVLDPLGISQGAWYWYARDIRAITLLGASRSAGLRTASVNWPVTVGAQADILVPEYYRSEHPENLSMIRAVSTPELLDAVEIARKAPLIWPFDDTEPTDIASFVIRTYQPALTLLHLVDLDSAQHDFGPGSPEALATLEKVDGQIARLVQTVENAGIGGETVVAIVSDHGFLKTDQVLQPNARFKEKGFFDFDADGRVTDWRAYFLSSGGSGFVYLKDPANTALVSEVRRVLDDLKADPANGIVTIWDAEGLKQIGAHPQAVFGIDMRDGFTTGGGFEALLKPSRSKGGHGFAPSRPQLHSSLILNGPPVKGLGSLGIVRITQIAPTLARWLGVPLSPQADQPLTLPAASQANR